MHREQNIILVGGGGHCQACIDVIETGQKFRIAGIVDRKDKVRQTVLGYEIIACDDEFQELVRSYRYFLVTIGQIHRADTRKEKFHVLKNMGAEFPVIIAADAYVSKYASIQEGTIIMHRAFINAHARIGENCIINSGAIIEHDASIGAHCHISTGSVINGECVIDSETFIGSQSVIANNVRIARNTLIGAGAVVMRSLDEPGVYVGNPAKRIR